jgi:hypothetical protein
MKSLIALYRQHIYGIIGTLVIHILLVGFFLLTEINQKGENSENTIEFEIPVELLNIPEEPEASAQTLKNQEEESGESGENQFQHRTNTASNRGLQGGRDRFFDEAYEKEITEAKQLVEKVNHQLSREIADIGNIDMPEDVTEGKSEKEIKNVIYSGESNIEYHLGKRYHLRLPVPVYLARAGGVVTVDIQVDREGKVVTAKVKGNISIKDEQIFLYSKLAAERSVFNADGSAPALQSGTITYTFVPQ